MFIKQTKIWRFFSSIKLAIWLLVLIALFSLIGTFIPQNKEPAEYIGRYGHAIYHIFLKIGLTNIYSAWWFILFLVLLSLNLIICLFNRFSLKIRLLGTLISHFSILAILTGALIGMFYGEKGFVRIREGEIINSFVSKNKPVVLDFSIRLDEFIYEEHIDPEEKLLVFSKDGELLAEVPVQAGRDSRICDSGYRVKILRFVPDFAMDISTKQVISRSFEPKNPALEIELTSSDGDIKKFWVFYAYPDIHKEVKKDFRFKYQWRPRRPKDFISKVTVIKNGKEVMKHDIRVNTPLRFGDYAFFQSSYDREHLSWSGFQIVKDPGVPVVYLGFILLILGLIMIFYINPLLQRRR